ncbi:hypothetical protein CLCR_03207 [Cladophialophora carrionii]|uniref:Uncharacterized protein n=1 Tax=Cladophialophora carrionii TaxID=86049 RepID=A0A1C1D1I2_9EURO|nr:hypothetical protein CLCR_03207 [Cladophialophora carrionii]
MSVITPLFAQAKIIPSKVKAENDKAVRGVPGIHRRDGGYSEMKIRLGYGAPDTDASLRLVLAVPGGPPSLQPPVNQGLERLKRLSGREA